MTTPIAALFVETNGAYFGIDGVDPWDVVRDARKYDGNEPVVAHPPCSRWCCLAGLVEARWGHKRGEDGGCFASALASVRRCGGVLEHPAYSDAWGAFGLARPPRVGGWVKADECGGWTCHVEQGRYGHPAKKATWLYAVVTDAATLPELRWGAVPDRDSTALVSWCGNHTSVFDKRPRVGKAVAARTPPLFREALVAIARSARRTETQLNTTHEGATARSYEQFIAEKSATTRFDGIDVAPSDLHPALKPHQRDLARWALRKGRAAIFADTGLGKSLTQLAWASIVSQRGRVLIAAPLGVAQQTVREGERWGIPCMYLREDDDTIRIVVTNYDMLHRFDPSRFVGVALDESSILKNHTGAMRNALVSSFAATPYRTCWTATPAPNDFTELGNHSEFLGVKTRAEMLAEYFVHDGGSTQDWRVKGHAVTAFWRWVATWGAVVRSPADLGHDDTEYRLPPLEMQSVVIETPDGPVPAVKTGATGLLFADDAASLAEQRALRRATLDARVAMARAIVDAAPLEPALVWCELNDEQDAIEEAFGDRAWSVRGTDTLDQKEQRIMAWLAGRRAVMIGKPSMLGMGLNFQHCARQIFIGASHSYEQTYQAVRRCWRFGQTRSVRVYVISADKERLVVENYRRKEADAARMAAEMALHVGETVRAEVCGASKREWNDYHPAQPIVVPAWLQEAA